METKKNRSIKVYGQSGYQYQETPTIVLKGKWLEELGFAVGDYITVSCEDGKLVITPDAERARLVEAEADFLERETRRLRAQFSRKRAKQKNQMVAEKDVMYNAKEAQA